MMLSLEQELQIEKIINRNHDNFYAKELERDYPFYQIIERKLRKSLREYIKYRRNHENTHD
jgi:hypothetical protein